MAAIIAKITRENRERIKNRKNTWGIRKSRYSLPAFKDHFDPEEDIKVLNDHLYQFFHNLSRDYLSYFQLSVALSGNGDLLAVVKIDIIA